MRNGHNASRRIPFAAESLEITKRQALLSVSGMDIRDPQVRTTENKPAETSDLRNPASPILDTHGLAALLGISPASIPALRSRSPDKLPPPFLSRPLRWRRETIIRWMDERERQEAIRCAQVARAMNPREKARRMRCASAATRMSVSKAPPSESPAFASPDARASGVGHIGTRAREGMAGLMHRRRHTTFCRSGTWMHVRRRPFGDMSHAPKPDPGASPVVPGASPGC